MTAKKPCPECAAKDALIAQQQSLIQSLIATANKHNYYYFPYPGGYPYYPNRTLPTITYSTSGSAGSASAVN